MPREIARWIGVWAAVAVHAASSTALAVQPDEVLSDAALEARARSLSAGFRCLVCQNQSIDDSDAPLARDLRILVRERLKAGDSDAAVKDFVVARYGEFVLLKPSLSRQTLILWLVPLLALATAALIAIRSSRRAQEAARRESLSRPLTADEEARLRDVLARSADDTSNAAS